jgi:hypothetical protein
MTSAQLAVPVGSIGSSLWAMIWPSAMKVWAQAPVTESMQISVVQALPSLQGS